MLVKLHYIFSSSCSSGSSSKGDSEDYTKRRSGFDICPFFLCLHYYTLSGRIRYNIHTWLCVCVCCLYKKTFLDMTWFDLVFLFSSNAEATKMEIRLFMVCVVEYSLE